MKKLFSKGLLACLFISIAFFNGDAQAGKTETAAPAVTQQSLTGKVLETMDAGGYTYLKVDTGLSQPWVAIPQTKVTVGQEVTYEPGMVMKNFASKTLNRTFDSIVFSSGLVGSNGNPHGGGMGSMPSPHGKKAVSDDSFASAVMAEGGAAAVQQQPAAGSGGSLGAMAPFSEISVEKAKGDNAYTVSEIFAKPEDLNGKTVRIQGKVVKFSPMIMGRNWVHLQDGTGDPMANTHDLVVTTSEKVENGKTITMEGILAANKDFGAGYKYVAIIEEAKTVK
ncbi:MAG TPA: DNA-binding protein [Desulfocapsa sulfexigens]|nr:DNA-binding protein [Desulfocapsa sulfexigens]